MIYKENILPSFSLGLILNNVFIKNVIYMFVFEYNNVFLITNKNKKSSINHAQRKILK